LVYNKRLKYIFLLILTLDLIKLQILLIGKKNEIELKKRIIKKYNFIEFLNNTINKKTILIFEPREFHNECTPGYTKYFIDLGYNVDILMRYQGIDSFSYFNDNIENIRMFLYNKLREIKKRKEFNLIIKKYDYILLETFFKEEKKLFKELHLYNNNSIFIFHEIELFDKYFTKSKYFNKNRVWTLGNSSIGLQVNPHYFGNIAIKGKSKKTKFFLTSTIKRDYKPLIESVNLLHKENLNFEIIVTGRVSSFNSNRISANISNNFIFNHHVSYSKLYQLVDNSDYIIILLSPDNKYDEEYKTKKVTGSYQLSLGFNKPCLINNEFADYYDLNSQNSLIYNNKNLYIAMKKAILMNNSEYKKIQHNLQIKKKEIYNISVNNVKRAIENLNDS
jgi:hypothetical protein